jgi:phosphoribosylamine--glycine ligase
MRHTVVSLDCLLSNFIHLKDKRMMIMAEKKVLIVGGGGREHSLAWALSRSPRVGKIYSSGGSDAMSSFAKRIEITPENTEKLAEWADEKGIDLTVIGPEAYLALGITDSFQERGLAVFGPSKQATRLESSKIFAKEFMARNNIPTASFRIFTGHEEAVSYINETPGPWVIKADGLAAGKGVVVADKRQEAINAIDEMMLGQRFGEAGQAIVIEEKMIGEELSLLAIADGKNYRTLLPAQDHKRVGEEDTGPNTGGMGAYSPTSLMTPDLEARIKREIIEPVLRGMAAEGSPFSGVLYTGLMITADGPKVVEFNVRFGDPETQAILPLMESDAYTLFEAAAHGMIDKIPAIVWKNAFSVCVVIAAGGYPGSYNKGDIINGLDTVDEDLIMFHAGTCLKDGKWLSNGGRVLNVVGVGSNMKDALTKVYRGIEKIHFNECYYRRDIGWREIHRDSSQG